MGSRCLSMIGIMVVFLLTSNAAGEAGIVSSDNGSTNEKCIPEVVVHGTVVFIPVEGGCWAFWADDGTHYEPYGGPVWMYVDGLKGTMHAVRRPWASICMVGIIVEVCMFEPDACMSNADCPEPEQFCKKPVGYCDGPGACAERPRICPFYYDPVCGCDGVTYGNECEAAANGVSLAHYGPCKVDDCKGDLDRDGDVDGSDLAIFAAGFGRTDCAVGVIPCRCDIDHDCDVDPDDFTERYYPICDVDRDGDCDGTDAAICAAEYGREDCCGDCPGDFDGDGNVDGSDLAVFASEYGRTDCLVYPRIVAYSNSGCLPGTVVDLSNYQYPGCGEDEIEVVIEDHGIHMIHKNATYNCCPDDIQVSVLFEKGCLRIREKEVLTHPCFCLCCYDVKSTVVDMPSGTYTLEYCWNDYETKEIECHRKEIFIP